MKVLVSKLQSHPLNEQIYALNNIDDLVASIKEVGLLVPLTINKSMQVVSGNRRLAAIKELGWQKVEVKKLTDAEEEQQEVLLVHHNKQRIKTWRERLNEADFLTPTFAVGQGKRTDLTSVPQNKSGRDAVAEVIGISSSQLWKAQFIKAEDDTYIDAIDEGKITVSQAYKHLKLTKEEREHNKKKLKSSSIPKTGDFIFHHKSSRQMSEVDDGSVQTIFTSPPYFRKRIMGDTTLGQEPSADEFVAALVDHLTDCWRVLSDKGSFFLNIGDTYQEGNLLNVPHRVVISLQDKGWLLRNSIIWNKPNRAPQPRKNGLTPSYEFIFHLTITTDYFYQHTKIPSLNPETGFRVIHRGNQGTEAKMVRPVMPYKYRHLDDYWTEDILVAANTRGPSNFEKNHPATFPERVVVLPLMQTSNEGDLVLDPFMGTGTTGKVANRLGRRFVGYDIEIY